MRSCFWAERGEDKDEEQRRRREERKVWLMVHLFVHSKMHAVAGCAEMAK